MRFGEPNRLQPELLFFALGAGVLIGLLYATLMLLRRLIRHGAVAVAVEDVLFCAAGSVLTFIFLLDRNSGVVRFYWLAAECVGFLCVNAAAAKIFQKNRKKSCKKDNV